MTLKVDPSCAACGGTGRNSNGNPCDPCQKNGASVDTDYDRATLANLAAIAECYPAGQEWEALDADARQGRLFAEHHSEVVTRLAVRRARGEAFHDALRAEGWTPNEEQT